MQAYLINKVANYKGGNFDNTTISDRPPSYLRGDEQEPRLLPMQ
jgi:hypothetical protein